MLTPQDDDKRLNSPPLQGRGRGWALSANAVAHLHGHASAMRRAPTEPEKRLWSHLSRSQLGGFKFRRQATIGRFIVDFVCPATGLIIEVDGDTHIDPVADAQRDSDLAALGYDVIRIANSDVMRNIDGVLQHLLAKLQTTPSRRPPHPNPSPEGEGLSGL
jgi:very-short-patch-repair endonuclease